MAGVFSDLAGGPAAAGSGFGDDAVESFVRRHPWWIHWRRQENYPVRDLLTQVLRDCWFANLETIRRNRGLSWTQLYDALTWERYWLERAWQGRCGAFHKNGGLPILYFYTLAGHFGVPIQDLLPEVRELFAKATARLFTTHQAAGRLGHREFAAYVEYHLQGPRVHYGRLDWGAARRTYANLNGYFPNANETARAISLTGRAIDSVLSSLPGRYP